MNTAPIYSRAALISAEAEPAGYLDLLIQQQEICRRARPGQFVMIRGWPGMDPLLPRPFDIVDTDPEAGSFRLIVKIEGRGTELLSRLRPGSELQVAGPLGQALTDFSCSSLALLARGVGAAAVVLLAREARRQGAEVTTFLSARTSDRLVARKYLEPLSTTLEVATDDGSAGYHGSALDLLDRLLAARPPQRLYSCGARRFARRVQALDLEGRIQGFVFLEGLMACGMGNCHGCAVKKREEAGYFLVCRDGPVFPAGKVVIA
jgi:dihydroorotate dehydrogenase electron transfer subunit